MIPIDQIYEITQKYKMTEQEIKAFKLCLLWEDCVTKECPGYKTRRITKGDPRKGILFRYCYKLAKETLGIIADNDYKNYIIAQLQILKSNTDGNVHALIDPQVLVGQQAWKRWLVWKKQFDQKLTQVPVSEEVAITASEAKVLSELDRTKKYLISQYGSLPTVDQLERSLGDRSLVRWITLGKVSPYFAILSPILKKALKGKTLEEVFMFDLSIYNSSITDQTKLYFNKEFA